MFHKTNLIIFLTIVLNAILSYFAYIQRGYFAVGGEFMISLFVVVMSVIYHHDKKEYGDGFWMFRNF